MPICPDDDDIPISPNKNVLTKKDSPRCSYFVWNRVENEPEGNTINAKICKLKEIHEGEAARLDRFHGTYTGTEVVAGPKFCDGTYQTGT